MKAAIAIDDYDAYVESKLSRVPATGLPHEAYLPNDGLFDHQRALVRWACRRGRAAIFADTGLGKSRMQLAWAEAVRLHTGRPVLILAPLAVAPQTVAEGAEIGVKVRHCRDGSDYDPDEGAAIVITNYDRLHRFDPAIFGGVVLDESSCIKHHDAKTLRTLMAAFRDTPFKLCATATPAPNDWTELGTHAEFLGVCTRAEMLAEYFTHDGGDTSVWRLKGHARHIFWRWVSQWGAMVRRPSDLGFDDSAYLLPNLHLHEHTVQTEMPLNGMLFAVEAQTLSERRDARRLSIEDRVNACIALVKGSTCEPKNRQPLTTNSTTSAGTTTIPSSDPRSADLDQERLRKTPLTCASTTSATRISGTGEHLSSRPNTTPHDASSTPATNSSEKPGSSKLDSTESNTRIEHLPPTSSSTDSPLSPMRECSPIKEGSAPSAKPPRTQTELSVDSTSTTAIQPAPSEAYCALPATLASASSKTTLTDFFGRPNTCANSDDQWVIWVDLNTEQDLIAKSLGDDCVSIYGSLDATEKEARYARWQAGQVRYLVSKVSIFGFGINMQFCRRMAFVGVTDSFEAYYQAVRRCWRFGQKRDVHVHVFASSSEGAVVANLKRKERDAKAMAESLGAETRDAVMQEVTGTTRHTNTHNASQRVAVPAFLKDAA